MDEEQDTEPETDSGQSVDTQEVTSSRSVREVITYSKSLQGSQADFHDHAQIKLS